MEKFIEIKKRTEFLFHFQRMTVKFEISLSSSKIRWYHRRIRGEHNTLECFQYLRRTSCVLRRSVVRSEEKEREKKMRETLKQALRNYSQFLFSISPLSCLPILSRFPRFYSHRELLEKKQRHVSDAICVYIKKTT